MQMESAHRHERKFRVGTGANQDGRAGVENFPAACSWQRMVLLCWVVVPRIGSMAPALPRSDGPEDVHPDLGSSRCVMRPGCDGDPVPGRGAPARCGCGQSVPDAPEWVIRGSGVEPLGCRARSPPCPVLRGHLGRSHCTTRLAIRAVEWRRL
jgi:hypothetical protein